MTIRGKTGPSHSVLWRRQIEAWWGAGLSMALLVALVIVPVGATVADERFTDHGVATRAVESRGVVTLQARDGSNLVISLNNDRGERGWLLVTDIDSGVTEQVYYPEEVDTSPSLAAPFASYVSTQGRFYTGAFGVLLEFEPSTREWLFHGRPNADAQLFADYAFAEGPDGTIYVGTTSPVGSSTHLISYDPETREAVDHGRMDPEETFIRFMAVDGAGWVYCGIGTARGNIVAFNPQTGEKRQIPPEDERDAVGSGWVFESHDGNVYGTVAGKNWRMYAGDGEVIDASERGPVKSTGVIGWTNKTGTFPDGRELVEHRIDDGWMEIHDPATEQTERIEFSYDAIGGMGFTSLAEGPDGMIYGSTCHPMRFVRYDPVADEMTDLGGVEGVGNFCAMSATGDLLAAVSYSDGILHLYDPAAPFDGAEGTANPRELTRWPEAICRPRVSLAHPDGTHLLMAGYAAYGRAGGGLGIYNLETDEASLLTHEDLVPHQSTITMDVLPDGRLVGGTDISAPGGGHVQATEAVVYILDFEAREVVDQIVPVPGAQHVRSLAVGPDALVYGVADGQALFVFDPEAGEIVHREMLPEYEAERFVFAHDGHVYALFHRAIIRIDPADFTHEVLGTPPTGLSYGGPVIDERLFYASRSNLWSFALTE